LKIGCRATDDKNDQPEQFFIPMMGDPRLHQNLRWWATEDERVLGVLILNLVDHDFSWVVLTRADQGDEFDGHGAYRAVNLGHSCTSKTQARNQLFAAMKQEAG
jgi:hypothetical protein